MGQESGHSLMGSSIATQLGSRAMCSSGDSTGLESTPKLTQVIGRLYFPGVVRMRALASGWLLAGGCPQLLEATFSSLSCGLLNMVTCFITSTRTASLVPASKTEFHIM